MKKKKLIQYYRDVGREVKCAFCPETRHGHLSVDHITPKSKGGNSSIWNLQLACKPCNNMKGNMTDGEFRRVKW